MSRDLDALTPVMEWRARLFLRVAEANGLDVLIYCTARSLREQARLFRRGRSLSQIRATAYELSGQYERPDLAKVLLGVGPQYGELVTYAAPGQSLHNYGYAWDGVPLRDGKPVWDDSDPLWNAYGVCVRACGCEWAGDWETFKEFPHAQEPNTNWRDLIHEVA